MKTKSPRPPKTRRNPGRVSGRNTRPVAICVLTYGDYPQLARRCLDSIFKHCDRSLYRLVVGANEVGARTKRYLQRLHQCGAIDRLILSPVNLHKCPMMRCMFKGLTNEFVWWFDDDSHVIEKTALTRRLEQARMDSPEVVIWGGLYLTNHIGVSWGNGDAVPFVRTASWYRGLTPPFWAPGGKGEFDFQGRSTGDGHWNFVPGGNWFIRSAALRQLDWPDRRLRILADDVLLCEAVRQQGWRLGNISDCGVVVSDASRRWVEANG